MVTTIIDVKLAWCPELEHNTEAATDKVSEKAIQIGILVV